MIANSHQEISCDNYLTIEALEDDLTVSFSVNPLQYSIDECQTWIELPVGTTTPTINTGEKIYFKATGLTPTSDAGIGTFNVNKQFNLSGNCMSMLFGDNAQYKTDLTGYDYAFLKLFSYCTTLMSVSAGFLPATTLSVACYSNMFDSCEELTTAPELPAIILVDRCYYQMFSVCRKLNYIKAMFVTDPGSQNYTSNWVKAVASTGTFVKNIDATWELLGSYGIPGGWTIETASA